MTKTDLATWMQTSLAAVSRLLDPENSYFNPQTMDKAARVLGKRLEFQLVE